MAKTSEYPFEIRPLAPEEGGGYLITFPDFADCVSDGETVEEAIANGRQALKETISALWLAGHAIPVASAAITASGKFVARVPKTVHASCHREQGPKVFLSIPWLSVCCPKDLAKKSAHA